MVSPVGAGGMGKVYRARDSRLNRDVALKILPPDVAADPSRRQQFEIEARAVAALNHPNVVAVSDVGEGYIVTELPGHTCVAVYDVAAKTVKTARKVTAESGKP